MCDIEVKIGDKFNNLTVNGNPYIEKRKTYSITLCEFKCDCGTVKVIPLTNVVNNKTVSCGCDRKKKTSQLMKDRNTKYISGIIDHPLYNSYQDMKKKCYNQNYKYYLRGIKVCDEWLNDYGSFYNWAINTWTQKASLKRLDESLDYSPDNCILEKPKVKKIIQPRIKKEVKIKEVKSRFTYTEGIRKHSLYSVYKRIKDICYNVNNTQYLGGDIKVCDEWRNDYEAFYNWSINNWQDGFSIQRFDKNLDFGPDNCFYAKKVYEKKDTICHHKLHPIYHNMKGRCKKNNINIYEEWVDSYENFYNWAINLWEDKKCLNRIDLGIGFNPDNCNFVYYKDFNRIFNPQKTKETCLIKYGVDNVGKFKEFHDKAKETNIIKYGFAKPTQSPIVKEKVRLTCQERYGVDSPSQNPDILAKQMKTCMQKYGTPFYHKTNLKTQDSIRDWLKSVGLEFKSDYTVLKTKEIDLYNEDLKIGIEYCGLYWHSEDRVGKTQHSDKFKNATKEEVRLFTIFSDEWKNRNEQVKSFILSALNINVTNLHGRKCSTQEITNTEAKKFLDTYHIQGSGRSHKFSVGLYHNEELVGVTTFNYHHRDKDKFVLDRLAFKTGFRISGGVSKMLKLGIEYCKANGIDKIITWSDNRWSTGKVYLACGFQLDSELDPDYYYIKLSNPKERLSKQAHTKKKIGCPEGLTEYEYMKELGYDRIWDCGKKRFVINV